MSAPTGPRSGEATAGRTGGLARAPRPLAAPGEPSPAVALSQWGDARRGKLADNLTGFGRCLRRAGVPVDAARMALAQQAVLLVGLARDDLRAAFEAVLIGREQDRAVFHELFDAYFRNPDVAKKMLAQMLPSAESKAEAVPRRPRVSEALAPLRAAQAPRPPREDTQVQLDAAMTASDLERLRQADFQQLSASEYLLVQHLARDIALPLPEYTSRRTEPGTRGHRPHWSRAMQQALRCGGEIMHWPRRERRRQPVPLVVLVDVSGSMERYARLLLAFVHAATGRNGLASKAQVWALGTGLTDLRPAFAQADVDAMLGAARAAITDYGGGTRLGLSLAQLRQHPRRQLVGRRSLVLLISDGLETGAPQVLEQELLWLRRHCGRLVWLNPLLRYGGYAPLAQGAAALHRQCHAMLAVHNLARLQDLARSLAQLLRQ